MRTLLLFGAGKSATALINYLLALAPTENWKLKLVDTNINLANAKIGNSSFGEALCFDIKEEEQRNWHIQHADLVISLLPPALHYLVAVSCVAANKNLLTASYIDEDIRKLQPAIEKKGLLFLCEMGLDPGIDHMSAMKMIDEIRNDGGTISSFKSHCGGLVAPESDNNPWHYKISWNTKSVVNAGKFGAHYKENGKNIHIDYSQLFANRKGIEIPGLGFYDWYPNRDSLSYASLYGLQQAETFIRTTLRHPHFMSGWNEIVKLQLTDEVYQYATNNKSLKDFFAVHFKRIGIVPFSFNGKLLIQLKFLGLEDEQTMIESEYSTASDVLQFILEKKLVLLPTEQDMIVMKHELTFSNQEKCTTRTSTLVVKGENSTDTAMAKTVGLPLGIAARLILKNELNLKGLQIPTNRHIYLPVLKELEKLGIKFQENE